MSTDDTFVYFIHDGEHVKIGWSADPEQRMSSLSTGNPRPLRLLGAIRGSESDEKNLHAALAPLRANGEWFRAEPWLLSMIDWLVLRDRVLYTALFELHARNQELRARCALYANAFARVGDVVDETRYGGAALFEAQPFAKADWEAEQAKSERDQA